MILSPILSVFFLLGFHTLLCRFLISLFGILDLFCIPLLHGHNVLRIIRNASTLLVTVELLCLLGSGNLQELNLCYVK